MCLNIVTTSRRVINFFIFSKSKKEKKNKIIVLEKRIFIVITRD